MERLADLPDGTVVDGELVAIDDSGRADFHLLQNFRIEAARIHYYIFDFLCCKDRDLTRLPLIEARRFPIDRSFYLGMAICAIIISVLGFAPSLVNTAARH